MYSYFFIAVRNILQCLFILCCIVNKFIAIWILTQTATSFMTSKSSKIWELRSIYLYSYNVMKYVRFYMYFINFHRFINIPINMSSLLNNKPYLTFISIYFTISLDIKYIDIGIKISSLLKNKPYSIFILICVLFYTIQ